MPVKITLIVVAYFCILIVKIVKIVDSFSGPTKYSNAYNVYYHLFTKISQIFPLSASQS